MTDLQTITKSLRAAVDVGDLEAIASGVEALERLAQDREAHWQALCSRIAPARGSKNAEAIFYLFGDPENEMIVPTSDGIRCYAEVLHGKLAEIADAADKLERDGWTLEIIGQHLAANHQELRTVSDVKCRLEQLDIGDEIITQVDSAHGD